MSSRWNSAQGSGMALAFWTACFHASWRVKQARNGDFCANRVCYGKRNGCREFEFAGIIRKRDDANSSWTSGRDLCKHAYVYMCVQVSQNCMTERTVYSEEVMRTVCQVVHTKVNERMVTRQHTGQHASKWKVGKRITTGRKTIVRYNLMQQVNCFENCNTLVIWLSYIL